MSMIYESYIHLTLSMAFGHHLLFLWNQNIGLSVNLKFLKTVILQRQSPKHLAKSAKLYAPM